MNSHVKTTAVTMLLVALLSSCIAPVNLNYESASMLDKNEFEVQGGFSYYPDIQYDFHGRIGYGVNQRYNVKLRVEYISVEEIFFEVDNKLRLNRFIAASLPVGIYASYGIFQFDPRFYFTYSNYKTFEVTVIPKCHVMYEGDLSLLPGISAGFGFSSDLRKWVVRPEIGYDITLSFGVGLSFYLSRKTDEKSGIQPAQL